MSSDVVLTSALRSNLLSLQSTQRNIDATQLRLATGLKVNSALDNPQNFFAGQSLNNRASDLSRLLDGIGQSITAIQQADTGVQGLTSLVEQADAIATQAREAVASGGTEARITGNRDLRGITDLTSLAGITNGDDLLITITDPGNATPGTNVDFDTSGATLFQATIDIATGDSIDQLLGKINDLLADTTDGDIPVVNASLDTEGRLVIKTLNGGDLNIDFVANAAVDADNLAFAADLGFGGIATVNSDNTNGNNNVEVTASASRTLKSFSLFEAAGGTNLAERSDLLEGLVNSQGTALFAGIDNAADEVLISINGGTAVTVELNGATIQNFVDSINTNDSLNGLIEAGFDDATGQITIAPLDASVESIKFDYDANAATDDLNFGFGVKAINNVEANTGVGETIRFGSAAAQLAELESEFNNVREQITTLARDSGYRGTNLLNGDDLTTFFDETRNNTLTTEGVVFDSDGLGIAEANFASTSTIDNAIAEVAGALDSLRSFGNSIANDLAIIQTRQDFTEKTINNLEEGRDKLIVADQNEEGANLLALQTRQQLGVTSLSLASQSQQAVLRLF
jgi:flagellin-like hook-associated protein FlgL